MADIANSTIDLLDTLLDLDTTSQSDDVAAGGGGPGGAEGINIANARRRKLVAQLKERGATHAKIQGVIKGIKHLKPKGHAAPAPKPAAPVPAGDAER